MVSMFDNLFLQPLLLIYRSMLEVLPDCLGMGERLIAFGFFLNILLLPLYHQMEINFRQVRLVRDKVGREVARMRTHFRGRERYFYVRAVYRQYRYHPISALLGSGDLLLQILIFATVYRLLSQPGFLDGHSFLMIQDISRPDGLLFGFNLLPMLMTVINAGAVFAYAEDRGSRLQALGLALLFLVLLYESPAGLVIYWTANNLFSLCRSLLQRRLLPKLPAWLARPIANVSNQY